MDYLHGFANILDDITIYGRDYAERDKRLRDVLDSLAKYGATLRAGKCVLGQPEGEFNGHQDVSTHGVRPLQSNVAALERIPAPLNQHQLSWFVGAATFYAKFMIPLVAELCQPFRPLLKMDSKWTWSESCQQAFDVNKQKIAAGRRYYDIST